MTQFNGIYPAVATPMDAEGALNEAALRQVLEFNIRAGVQGFWLAGGSGESILLEDDENKRIAQIAADQSKGRAVNIMHIGAATTKRTVRLAEHAARAGVEAICCVPPFFYGRSDEEIVEYFRSVGAAADLPLFVYNLPSSTRVEITTDLISKIQDRVPQLAGLKHSSPNFANIRAFAEMGLSCFTGSCALMLPGLTIGACGAIDGPPNAAPEAWVAIWNAYQKGDLPAAIAAQQHATQTASVFRHYGFHASLKAVLSHRLGVDCGAPRLPALPLTLEQRQDVIARAEAIGLHRVTL